MRDLAFIQYGQLIEIWWPIGIAKRMHELVLLQFPVLVHKINGNSCGLWKFFHGYEFFGGESCVVFYPIMQLSPDGMSKF